MGGPRKERMASLNAEEAPSEPGVVFNGRTHVPADALIKIIKALNGIPPKLLLLVPLTCQGFNRASRAACPYHEIWHLLLGAIGEAANEATKSVSARQRATIVSFPRGYRDFQMDKDLEPLLVHRRNLIELEQLGGDFPRKENAKRRKEIRMEADERLLRGITHNILHYLLKYGEESVYVRIDFHEQDVISNAPHRKIICLFLSPAIFGRLATFGQRFGFLRHYTQYRHEYTFLTLMCSMLLQLATRPLEIDEPVNEDSSESKLVRCLVQGLKQMIWGWFNDVHAFYALTCVKGISDFNKGTAWGEMVKPLLAELKVKCDDDTREHEEKCHPDLVSIVGLTSGTHKLHEGHMRSTPHPMHYPMRGSNPESTAQLEITYILGYVTVKVNEKKGPENVYLKQGDKWKHLELNEVKEVDHGDMMCMAPSAKDTDVLLAMSRSNRAIIIVAWWSKAAKRLKLKRMKLAEASE